MLRAKKIVGFNCIECRKSFMQYPSQMKNTNTPFCSKSCWYSWKSKNVPAWNKGKTKETDSRLCYERPTTFKKGEHPSPSTEFKKGDKVGSKNNLWRGGICPLNALVRTSPKYKDWRKAIFERDDYRCQECFVRGAKLHVDHKKTFASIMREFLHEYSQFSPIDDNFTLVRLSESYTPFWDMDNGQTLCIDCHKQTPSYLKR